MRPTVDQPVHGDGRRWQLLFSNRGLGFGIVIPQVFIQVHTSIINVDGIGSSKAQNETGDSLAVRVVSTTLLQPRCVAPSMQGMHARPVLLY
jgi:hypothetical protein